MYTLTTYDTVTVTRFVLPEEQRLGVHLSGKVRI